VIIDVLDQNCLFETRGWPRLLLPFVKIDKGRHRRGF